MKIILTIFCALMALFGGGCAILAASSQLGVVSLIPVAVLVLNLLVLAGLWAWHKPWKPAFYILGTVDVIVAVAAAIGVVTYMASDVTILYPGILLVAAFAFKGILTFIYARKVTG